MAPFGLIFAAAGLACWIGGLGMCAWNQRMRSWEPEMARIVAVSPSESTVSYEHRRDGRVFTGQFRPDGDGPSRSWEVGREVPVRVHPQDASRSHAGDVRATPMPLWLGVFALTHGGIGLGLLGGAVGTYRREKRREGLRSRWPAEPWKWRPDWEQGFAAVESAWGASRWLWAYAAVAWNSLAWWTTWLLIGEPTGSGWNLGAGFGAMAAGMVLAWMTWKGFQAEQEGRGWSIRIPSQGLALGEEARLAFVDPRRRTSGAVLRVGSHPAQGMRVWQVRCVERVVRGQGEDSVTRTRERWSGDVSVREDYGSGAETELTVRLPSGAGVGVTTAYESGDNGVRWELVMGRAREFGREERTFLLPVFRNGAGPGPELAAAVPWPDEPEAVPEPEVRAAAYEEEKVVVERRPGGLRCGFRRRRHAMPATTSMVLAVVFGGVGMVAVWPFVPLPGMARGISGVFGVIGAFLFRGALRQNFAEFEVDAGPDRLAVTERCLGWTFLREWSGDAIQSLEVGHAGSYNNVPFYLIQMVDQSGRRHGLTPLLARRSTAVALAEDLEAALQKGRPKGAER